MKKGALSGWQIDFRPSAGGKVEEFKNRPCKSRSAENE